jgi:hypothetical protein
MTYATDEASTEDGSPVELYEFVGTVDTFRYTNAEANVSFSGDTYYAIPLLRSAVEIPGDGGAPQLSVKMPISVPFGVPDLPGKYVFQIAPPELDLTMYRLHIASGSSITFWRGPVAAFAVKEGEVDIVVPTYIGRLVEDKIPQVNYQRYCNNTLFGDVCGVVAADFMEATTVSSISADGKTITVASMGAQPDDWAKGGDIVDATTGEKRLILSQEGNVLTILWPFSVNVVATTAVEVYTGCAHTIDTCDSKFSNTDNFTGMPFVLRQNSSSTQES